MCEIRQDRQVQRLGGRGRDWGKGQRLGEVGIKKKFHKATVQLGRTVMVQQGRKGNGYVWMNAKLGLQMQSSASLNCAVNACIYVFISG